MRLFLESLRIPGPETWKATGQPCWNCARPDLTLRRRFRPLLAPEAIEICLDCGAVEATYVTDAGRTQGRGRDWTTLDGVVLAFRHAVRERLALAEDEHTGKDDLDFWNV